VARRGIFLLAGVVIALPQSATGQATVTLDEAIQRALVRSPAMAQQEQSVGNAAASQRQAWGSMIPGISASSGASVRSTSQFDPTTQRIVQGSSDSYNAGLSASITVFDGGRMFSNLAAARADYRAAEARREDARNQVTLQTKQLFFAALRQVELLEVARERVRQAEESLGMTRRRQQVGTATSSDTLRARLELINAQQAVLNAEVGTRAAQFALGRQIGESAAVAAADPGDLSPEPLGLSEEEILTIAEMQSPSVVAAAEAGLAAAKDVSMAKAAYLPSMRFSSGYSWANQDRSFSGGTTSWSLSFSASYPIFNGFSREGQVDRAQFNQRVARLQEDDARLSARQQADGALQGVVTAERAIEIAEEGLAVAEEDLRVVRERYRVGVATILELVTSQIAVVQASVDVVVSRYDYVLARAELEAVLGREL
jgi:outer membrane protein TolC